MLRNQNSLSFSIFEEIVDIREVLWNFSKSPNITKVASPERAVTDTLEYYVTTSDYDDKGWKNLKSFYKKISLFHLSVISVEDWSLAKSLVASVMYLICLVLAAYGGLGSVKVPSSLSHTFLVKISLS